MFNSTNADESSYSGVMSESAGTPVSDYPFTMHQYPATQYPSTGYEYSDDPMTNSWTAEDEMEQTSPPSRASLHQHGAHHHQQQQQQQGPAVPDAVINMAAKVSSDKKPFAYIADVNDIRQQRDRVRRKYVRSRVLELSYYSYYNVRLLAALHCLHAARSLYATVSI